MSHRLTFILGVGLAAFTPLIAMSSPDHSGPEYRQMGPDIFDRSAEAEKLITSAIERAARERKRIVLFFGANWCPWCRRLHKAIMGTPEVITLLNEQLILVYVDANTRNDKRRNATTLERFGNPVAKHGLPVLVELESDGTLLAVQETASIAAPSDDEVARRLQALLKGWIAKSKLN